FVTGLGGADKVVVGDAHLLKQRPELRRHCVSELLRGSSGGAGGALNFLSVLVCAGKEKRVIAQQPFATRHPIAYNRGIGVSDVRTRVHVINGRYNVELFALIHSSLLPGKS